MKVINETAWDTKDLRAITLEALKQFPAETETVEFVYTRSGGSSRPNYITGLASVGGVWVKIRLPKPKVNVKVAGSDGTTSVVSQAQVINPIELAAVLTHEFAHNRGMRHGDMAKSIQNCSVTSEDNLEQFAWALEFQIGLLRAKPAVEKPLVDLKAKRKDKVESKLVKLLHQKELLDARIQKLLKKQKYYSKVAA